MPGRILVVDDVATNRVVLRSKLTAAYYDVREAGSGEEALLMAALEEPDLVLLDVMMPGLDGFEVCRRLKSDPATMHVPVIIVTALADPQDRVDGLEAGADDFLTKPFDDIALFARVSSLTRMKMMIDELRLRDETSRDLGQEDAASFMSAAPPSGTEILVVSDDTALVATLQSTLRDALRCRVQHCADEAAMRALMANNDFDAFLLDDRPAGSGHGADALRLCAVLRTRPETRQAAVLVIVGEGRSDRANVALDIGASDYVLQPIDTAELTARMRSQLRRKRYSDQLRSNMRDSMVQAVTDHMTGVYNRRYAAGHLENLLARKAESGAPLAAMMLDLDRFKSINDRFGHPAGDRVIREFARRLVASCRPADLVARMGGEEFLVVMPDISPELAARVAERVRAAVEEPDFSISDEGDTLGVTVSIGLAIHEQDESADELIRRADLALYDSKNAGRNRVTLHAA